MLLSRHSPGVSHRSTPTATRASLASNVLVATHSDVHTVKQRAMAYLKHLVGHGDSDEAAQGAMVVRVGHQVHEVEHNPTVARSVPDVKKNSQQKKQHQHGVGTNCHMSDQTAGEQVTLSSTQENTETPRDRDVPAVGTRHTTLGRPHDTDASSVHGAGRQTKERVIKLPKMMTGTECHNSSSTRRRDNGKPKPVARAGAEARTSFT